MKKVIIALTFLFATFTTNAQTLEVVKDSSGKEIVVGLPAGFRGGRLVKDTLNTMYYVILYPDISFDDYYKRFKIFSGKDGKSLKEKKILKPVDIYRDGGTTIIESSIGTFYFPPSMGMEKETPYPTLTFSGKVIKLVEIED